VKLLVLIQGREVAASRYRILQYLPCLEEHGVESDVMEFPDTIFDYIRLFCILKNYDCVFVQRKRFHFPFLKLFRTRARRIVYDLDDAVMFRNSLNKNPYSATRKKRFIKMVRNCDTVIAGNSFLMDQALPYNSDVTVIPTSIPAGRYTLKDYSIKKDIVTIGWIGDHGSIHYLEEMKDLFDEVASRYSGKVELKIICDVFFDCKVIPVKKIRWSSDTEVEEIKDCDIGVMPLKDDLWSWGKCGLKILQYFGVGIPVVCTPVGVNRDVVKPGENGCWAENCQEWIDALSMLIEDAGKRKLLGINGRQTLESGYTLESNSAKLLNAILKSDNF